MIDTAKTEDKRKSRRFAIDLSANIQVVSTTASLKISFGVL